MAPVRAGSNSARIRGGQAAKRSVKTGMATSNAVELTSGVSAGEEVAIRGAFSLQDGDRVTVAGEGV